MVKEGEKEKNSLKHKRRRIELNKDGVYELKMGEKGTRGTPKKGVKKVDTHKVGTKPKSLKSPQ